MPGPTLSDRDIVQRISSECLAVRVRVLNRLITGIYDEALRPHGVTVGQVNVLAVLARLGSADPSTVAAVLRMEKSTVSRNVERMCRNGWVERLPGDDARRQALRITRAGRGVLRRAFPAWQAAQERADGLLGADAGALFELSDRAWRTSLGRDRGG